jgi:hypothetical protein
MFHTRDIRRTLVERRLFGFKIDTGNINKLVKALQQLEKIPVIKGKYTLDAGEDHFVRLDLSYEIEELKKDIYFLTHSFEEFFQYLEKLHPGFIKEINEGKNVLKSVLFRNFITDRDGTVNNYCGRYRSSIQSIYNAVFLSYFAQRCTENPILLTSAPLDNGGLLDIIVLPERRFIYAGSKGREYINKNGGRNRLPIEKTKQEKLDLLNNKLIGLVKQPEYAIFSLIGSGLQFKFGQTTIARQDVYGSVPEQTSKEFYTVVREMVDNIDPGKSFFRIEDTGKDIEIILTVQEKGSVQKLKDFDKGDGVRFLNNALKLDLETGPNLICGDTSSDVPMLSAAVESTADTWAIFVTEDGVLKREVKKICPQSFFVSEPDMLVALLYTVSEGEYLP